MEYTEVEFEFWYDGVDQDMCQSWVNGTLRGSIPHIMIPVARAGGVTVVGCWRCGKDLYEYSTRQVGSSVPHGAECWCPKCVA